jgi:chaperone BCS1
LKFPKITRTKRNKDYGHSSELKIRWVFTSSPYLHRATNADSYGVRSVVARNNNILKQLVLEAKREYEKDAEHRVHIYMADT